MMWFVGFNPFVLITFAAIKITPSLCHDGSSTGDATFGRPMEDDVIPRNERRQQDRKTVLCWGGGSAANFLARGLCMQEHFYIGGKKIFRRLGGVGGRENSEIGFSPLSPSLPRGER